MMSVRILHCGESIENYNICIDNKIVGFTKRTATIGDLIYISVKKDNESFCGVRGVIAEITDERPWRDEDNYVQSFHLKDMEFCNPFPLKVLAEIGGKYWGAKYMQSSKAIKDKEAISLLNSNFLKPNEKSLHKSLKATFEEIDTELSPIEIMGTYTTIKFHSEQHKSRGLETLVNKNFYNLFDDYQKRSSILISDNRKFITSSLGSEMSNGMVKGISSIPDALLINFNKRNIASPFQLNLIEYECYGQNKTKLMDKFNYLNGHIIPQLMRFASAFSIATDSSLRDSTIKSWVEKIIEHIYADEDIIIKVSGWIREIHPDINEQKISLELHKLLTKSFHENLRIMLIIDELTTDQKDTIKNIIGSFKLGSEKNIEFLGFVVRLEQRINVINDNEYALSLQK
ncbi:hypothetical protein C2145_11410 [Bacillus velezensis]|nr:hypothetical protein C2145_11410 [Bacillus velezensis]